MGRLIELLREARTFHALSWLDVAREVVGSIAARCWCEIAGHRLVAWADAENGCEEVECERCGFSDTYWF